MEEYVCVTVQSQPNEAEAAFSRRLSRFWTHMLRQFPIEFESVFAETTNFERTGDRLTRQYLAAAAVIPLLESEMQRHGIDYLPIDLDETYSKFEAVSPEWMQIEH